LAGEAAHGKSHGKSHVYVLYRFRDIRYECRKGDAKVGNVVV